LLGKQPSMLRLPLTVTAYCFADRSDDCSQDADTAMSSTSIDLDSGTTDETPQDVVAALPDESPADVFHALCEASGLGQDLDADNNDMCSTHFVRLLAGIESRSLSILIPKLHSRTGHVTARSCTPCSAVTTASMSGPTSTMSSSPRQPPVSTAVRVTPTLPCRFGWGRRRRPLRRNATARTAVTRTSPASVTAPLSATTEARFQLEPAPNALSRTAVRNAALTSNTRRLFCLAASSCCTASSLTVRLARHHLSGSDFSPRISYRRS
jgi:hypothetical protein